MIAFKSARARKKIRKMAEAFKPGDVVLVLLPNYQIRRRAVVNAYNKRTGNYSVTMNRTGANHDVPESAIKAVGSQLKSDDAPSYPPSLLPSVSPKVVTRRRRSVYTNSEVKSALSDETLLSKSYNVIESVKTSPPDDLKVRYLKMLFSLLFGFLILRILYFCSNSYCEDAYQLILSNLGLIFNPVAKNMNVIYSGVVLLITHGIVYFSIHKLGFQNAYTDTFIPLISGISIYFLRRFSILSFSVIFDNICGFACFYFIFSILCMLLEVIDKDFRAESRLKSVFFHQHSILLMIIAVSQHVLNERYVYVENYAFYYLFFYGFIVSISLRLQNSHLPLKVNYLSLLVCRPFLLTIPVLTTISQIYERWHIVCYVPLFLVFMTCFIKQIEPKESENTPIIFKYYVVNTISKICIVGLAGIYFCL